MTLLLIDGFEDLTSWTPSGVGIATGRNGNCLQATGGSSVTFSIPSSLQTNSLTVGVAFRTTQTQNVSVALLDFRSDSAATTHLSLQTTPQSGILTLSTGGTTRYTSVGGTIALNQWYYLELQAVLSDTGSVTLRMNGTTLYTSGSVDTKNAGTKIVFDSIVMSGSGGTTNYWDDFYATNSIDTFWGDITVETLYPDGMDTTAWTGSDGDAVNNHLLVDEPGTPVDTDYVQSSTVAAREVYTVQNLSRTSGSVLGTMVQCRANKSDSGARGLKVVAKESGGTIRSTADNALTTTFTDYPFAMEKKNDGTAWTITDINALGIGVEVGS